MDYILYFLERIGALQAVQALVSALIAVYLVRRFLDRS